LKDELPVLLSPCGTAKRCAELKKEMAERKRNRKRSFDERKKKTEECE
jgi:hypothetical protein